MGVEGRCIGGFWDGMRGIGFKCKWCRGFEEISGSDFGVSVSKKVQSIEETGEIQDERSQDVVSARSEDCSAIW